MRWVTMATNGLLGRVAYDKATSRMREVVVKEEPSDEGAMVWIPPAYAVGAWCRNRSCVSSQGSGDEERGDVRGEHLRTMN